MNNEVSEDHSSIVEDPSTVTESYSDDEGAARLDQDEDEAILKSLDNLQGYKRPPLKVTVVPREAWTSIPRPEIQIPFNHPVQNVLITHTGTKSCKKSKDCIRIIKQLQRNHIAMGVPDIAYNFLIGGDGLIYEGRGWQWQGGIIPKYPETYGEVIKIAHIGYYGDHSKKIPSYNKVKLQYDFIETGMRQGFVPYNATMIPDYNEKKENDI